MLPRDLLFDTDSVETVEFKGIRLQLCLVTSFKS